MLIHTFRGPGRVFGFTRDAAGANLPAPESTSLERGALEAAAVY